MQGPFLPPDPDELRRQEGLARRLAARTVDPELAVRLTRLADEYGAQASACAVPASGKEAKPGALPPG